MIAVTLVADSIIFASPLRHSHSSIESLKIVGTSAAVLMIAADTSAFVDTPTLRGYGNMFQLVGQLKLTG